MKVQVIHDKCQGHNRCFVVAPQLFELDDEGYAYASGDGIVPEDQQELARLAAENCPELAIVIEED